MKQNKRFVSKTYKGGYRMNKVAAAIYICSSVLVMMIAPNKIFFIMGLALLARGLWIDWIDVGD